jgi:DNA helicase II / ATP-dependent DNA helicase PcrA
MTKDTLTLESLWQAAEFQPNRRQEAAIKYVDGPLYLPAGPGSGKTKVLLWRALNLIVFHGIEPQEIFLSTFTEKAARQLKEGIRTLLGYASAKNGREYDITRMYVGTVHSLCQRLTLDRRFAAQAQRPAAPHLLDELGQYFFMYQKDHWDAITKTQSDANSFVNQCCESSASRSRHRAVGNCAAFFNRLSEECIDPVEGRRRSRNSDLKALLRMYERYAALLAAETPPTTDFSLLQRAGLAALQKSGGGRPPFRHVIIDEYQDTNTIQEQLFFELAKLHKNICVVGDDDQALYRFRGATVENFVQFPKRCRKVLGKDPKEIVLNVNYRSRRSIVDFCKTFIEDDSCDWRRSSRSGEYCRVTNKDLEAKSDDSRPAVVASTPDAPDSVCDEIADLVKELIDKCKVQDPNQIAFLYPTLGSAQVSRMVSALSERGLRVYAPRAGNFLECEEPRAVFGLLVRIFGQPGRDERYGGQYEEFHKWLDGTSKLAGELMKDDPLLAKFIEDRKEGIKRVVGDYRALQKVAERAGWDNETIYDPAAMRSVLLSATELSAQARKSLEDGHFEAYVQQRKKQNWRPFRVSYVINRASSLDWTVLDLFYQLCSFRHLRAMFDAAQSQGAAKDEGPICNLGLISQYIGRFVDDYSWSPILTGRFLNDEVFVRTFFGNYMYTLFRLGQSEYENPEDPFPKGRIPFITIHQAKGLEFPVVVLGNPRKKETNQPLEELIDPLLEDDREPLGRRAVFDVRRMFYVALSRAKNMLVIAHYKGQGQHVNEPFDVLLDDDFPRIPDLDTKSIPAATEELSDVPESYSYTGDYQLYDKCPRQYMIFRKYGFVPSRSQTMFFGSLVHQTIEDLHYFLMAERGDA